MKNCRKSKTLVIILIFVMCLTITPTYAVGPGFWGTGIGIATSILLWAIPSPGGNHQLQLKPVTYECTKAIEIEYINEDGTTGTMSITLRGELTECESGKGTCTPRPCNI